MLTINLLPAERRRALAQEYYLKLAAIFLALVASMTIVAGLMLVPTYTYVSNAVIVREAELQSLVPAAAPAPEVAQRVAALTDRVATIQALVETPHASAALRAFLNIPRVDVTVSSVNYVAGANGLPSTLLISGVAATRDAVRAYQLVVQAAPFVQKAEVPVAVYAKDVHVPFSMTITLRP